MKAGYRYRSVLRDGECVRLSFACATGIARRKIKHIDPTTPGVTVGEWLAEWDDEFERHGYRREMFYPDGTNEPEGFWIAGVRSFDGVHHALVMRGRELWFDPAHERTQRPHKFDDGWRLIPLDN